MKNIFLILASLTLLLSSCGRKGALKNPPGYARPNFENVIEEE